ncbi:unnamed protein product [Moneuplotes crassus]|uniref:NET domain-containing protein n=2 Tax=Euplotes crassus TaxID=5936 RepID=A0AAD1UH14_EUPCR|nr:unnamed protein product [Moneuplotes crassus]
METTKNNNTMDQKIPENNFDDPLAKYDDIDVSKHAIELNQIQCAYLHSLLPGNTYKFQPEESTKNQMIRRKNKRKKKAKSGKTDSVISNSDKMSFIERNLPENNDIIKKKDSTTPSKAPVVKDRDEVFRNGFEHEDKKSEENYDKELDISESISSFKSEEEVGPKKKPSEAHSIQKAEECKVEKPASQSDQAPPQEAKSNGDQPSVFPRLSKQEKRKLRENIFELKTNQIKGVIKIVTKGKEIQKESLEFDISKLSPRTAHTLKKYVDECKSCGEATQMES